MFPQHNEELKDNRSLNDCTYANTPRFNFDGKTFEAKCVKVYDGDTITVVFKIFKDYHKFSVRMDGYDSPELRSKESSAVNKELEQKWARRSQKFLSDMIMNKIILLTCKKYDKYGRILGSVKLNGMDINDIMLSRGYCRSYSGGHKYGWDFSSFEKKYKNNNM